MHSRRSFAATLAAGLCSVAVAAAPALAAPITVVPPTSPPGQFTEQNLAADRTGANYFYRIPALAHVGDGVVLHPPRHPVTQEERDRGFFRATSTWSVTATGRRASTYEVDGGEVDVVVRAPALAGAQSVELVDANGDRYASVAEQVVVTTTVGNPGNVALDDLDAAAAGIDQHTLAIGASVTGQRSITLTQADLDAGRVNVPALDVTATNGEKPVATTIEAVEFALDVKPPKPTTEPPLVRVDWDTMTPAIDLGTARKCSRGATVTLHGLEYGQWYYLHLAKDGQRIGWFFPELDDTITFVLPADVPNGATAVTVLDASGELVSFAKIVVNPR